MGKQRKYGVDLFRILAAFSVVILHIDYNQYFSADSVSWNIAVILRLLSRWAVPFFFLASGFFFQIKYDRSPDFSWRALFVNLCSVYVVANLFYGLINLLANKAFKFNAEMIFMGTYYHLWFISALITGYVLMYIIKAAKISTIRSFIISCVFLLLTLTASTYNFLLDGDHHPVLSSFSLSVAFLILGSIIAEKSEEGYVVNKRNSLIISGAGLVMCFGEALLLYKNTEFIPYNALLLLGTIILSIGVFLYSLVLDIREDNIAAKAGLKYSLLIYLYHPLFKSIIFIVYSRFISSEKLPLFIWISPVAVFLATYLTLKIVDKFFPVIPGIMSGKLKK